MSADENASGQHEQGEQAQDERRVEERALLLPEERAAGSDDPAAQAAAILADSDLREDQPGRTQQDSPQSPDLDS